MLRSTMPELDAVRGLAILGVLFYHGFYWARWRLHGAPALLVRATEPGWAGVDLFFALSGFLISGILLDSPRGPGYFRNFYIRRALRIWPAYFGFIALLALAVRLDPAFVLASTFFMANLASLLGAPMQYGPLWSLALEEQFYLVWPLGARFATRRLLAAVAIAILLLEPLLRYQTFQAIGAGYAIREIDHRTWLHLDGLVLGALLAIYLRSAGASRRGLGAACTLLFAAAATIAGAGAAAGVLNRARPLGAALLLTVISLAATGVVAGFLWLGSGRFRAWAAPRSLRFLGRISYGLYLVHVLAFELYDRAAHALAPGLLGSRDSAPLLVLRFVIAAALATAVAALSRRYFEEPFLRLKGRFTRRAEGPAALARQAAA